MFKETETELNIDADGATSTAIVKSEKAKGGGDVADSDVLYADDEVPFGPLGIFPEKYTDLQAKVRVAAPRPPQTLSVFARVRCS